MAIDPSEFGPGSQFEQMNPDYNQLTPQQQVMRGYAWASDPERPAPEGSNWGDWERVGSGTAAAAPTPSDNAIIQQFIQMLMSGGMGGGFGGGALPAPSGPQFGNAELNQIMQ